MTQSVNLLRAGFIAITMLLVSGGLLSAESGNGSPVAESGLTSLIRNAVFMERTPEFTDLYIIQTWDKGRQIVIYCNAAYCYKQHGHQATV